MRGKHGQGKKWAQKEIEREATHQATKGDPPWRPSKLNLLQKRREDPTTLESERITKGKKPTTLEWMHGLKYS